MSKERGGTRVSIAERRQGNASSRSAPGQQKKGGWEGGGIVHLKGKVTKSWGAGEVCKKNCSQGEKYSLEEAGWKSLE